jgi:hypothetical protein
MVISCVLCVSLCIPASAATTTITDNNSLSTAYSYGNWENACNYVTQLAVDQNYAYYKFTIDKGEKIYARCSWDSRYEGMSVSLLNSSKTTVDSAESPTDVINADSLTPFLAVDCDGTKDSQTFYIKVSRGASYLDNAMYFAITFAKRIRTGNATFSFSGTATNAGNSSLSLSGVDSSVLSLNLTNTTAIPSNAIVTSVTTSGVFSTKQGVIHQMLLPAASSTWYTSTTTGSGTYSISESDGYIVQQIWKIKYNAMGQYGGTMKKATISFKFKYDLANNNYDIFVS